MLTPAEVGVLAGALDVALATDERLALIDDDYRPWSRASRRDVVELRDELREAIA